MGFLSRLMGRRRGPLAEREPGEDEQETPRLPQPPPTPTTRRPAMPDPTPGSQMPEIGGTTGTRSYRTPSGTPSTERLHNPTRPGRET